MSKNIADVVLGVNKFGPMDSVHWHGMVGDSYPAVNHDLIAKDPSKETEKNENVSKIKLKLQEIQDAHYRIKDHVVLTPVVESKYIGKKLCKVYFKCEQLQNTGSFKARGACNVLNLLTPAEKSKGCTIAGGRNFVAAMTYYGHRHSIPVNVIVPRDCPLADRQRMRENFAIVKTFGTCANEAGLHALTYCDEIGCKYIHGSDRVDLIAGYGTLGLELLTQLSELDAVICPVGSGGLVASLVLAVKSLKPNILIYGVECTAAPLMSTALKEKRPMAVPFGPTIAESLAQTIASYNAFNIVRGYLDKLITVDETSISRAMITLWEQEKLMVEGAAAVSVAAILADKVPELAGKKVVCILTGGNLNSSRLARAIDRGMAADGRLVKLVVTLPDVTGAMARLLTRVTETGADVRSLLPERAWMRRDIGTVSVNMLIETADRNHSKELQRRLMKEYPQCHFIML